MDEAGWAKSSKTTPTSTSKRKQDHTGLITLCVRSSKGTLSLSTIFTEREAYITSCPVAIWLEAARRCTKTRQKHLEAAPWGEDKRRGGYPPEQQEGPELEMKAQLIHCETCGLDFMTSTQGW
eukprot:6667220-Heterocapsa_arctica.AAC.1